MFGGQREEGISLDAVVAQYIKNTDLNQYNTEEPVRIINGLPESNEQPDTSKEDNDNNHSTNGHDGQQQTPDSNNDDKDNTGHINDNDDKLKTIMKLILLIKIMSLNSLIKTIKR